MHAYLGELIERAPARTGRRHRQRAASRRRSTAQPLTEMQLLSYCELIVEAGNETTRNAISGGLLAFSEHRDQWEQLRDRSRAAARRGRGDAALREPDHPLHPHRDGRRRGARRRRSARATSSRSSSRPANRDEEVFDDPFAFRIDRDPNPHLAFGIGDALLHGRAPRAARDGDRVPPPARPARVVRGDRTGGATQLGGERRDQAPPGSLPPRLTGVKDDAMEYRPFGAHRPPGLGDRLRLPGGRRRLRRHRRGASSRAPSAARSTSASTCFDTAEAYGFGASEEALGRALGGRRDEAIVSTKFGTGYQDRPTSATGGRERVRASIDASLQRLGTDHVDVYTVHWPDRDDAVRGDDGRARRARARGQGALRRRLELHRSTSSRRACGYGASTSCSTSTSLFDRRMERDILPYCAEHDIGVRRLRRARLRAPERHARRRTTEFPADDWRSKTDKWGVMSPLFEHLFGPGAIPRNVAVVDDLQRIAARYGRTPAAARAALGDRDRRA